MSEEKMPKHFWIIGVVICALIAILATIDLSGVWRDDPVESPEVENQTKETHLNDTLMIRLQIEGNCEVKTPPVIRKTKKSK
jgi:hypothetical protein